MKNSTVSDFFAEQTEKSAIKSAIVTKFFKIYIRIINSQFNKKIYYIDLFSGPGKYEDGNSSTPMHILDAIQSYEMPIKIQCVFNERDKKLFNELVSNITSHSVYNSLIYKPIITNMDAANVNLSNYLKDNAPAFSFVDPFGYKSTSANQIVDLINNIGSDCIFFLNANRIIMDFDKSNKESDFIDLFGKYYGAISNKMSENESHHKKMEIVLRAFSANLQNILKQKSCNYKLFILPFGFSFDDRIKDSHYLLFITKNHKAVSEMKKVMASLSNTISEIYSYDSKSVNQLMLFNIEDDGYNNFKNFINKTKVELSNKSWTFPEFYEKIDELSMEKFYKVTPFTNKDMKNFLRKYYEEQQIVCNERFRGNEIFSDKKVFKLKES